jgi:signal transduction histidine kinase
MVAQPRIVRRNKSVRKPAMTQTKRYLPGVPLVVQQYGLAVLSVAVALGISLFLSNHKIENVEFPVFLIAITVSVWYAGVGPAIVALVLAALAFDYYFTEPRYTLYVTLDEIPYYAVFILFALLITWFAAVRRKVERNLIESRDKLQLEVAERKRREDEIGGLNHQLERRSSELEATNKELEAFAYSISHDLRAPLRHIIGYTELLQKHLSSATDDKGHRYMATILESGKRMGILIDDLLAFSRIGRAETRETMVSLDQLIQEVQGEVVQETEGRNITWRVGSLPDLYGDRSMLKLALVNLVSNAIKFTRPRASAEIEIGVCDQKSNGMVVFIRDNGVGFDMKYVNKLFGVFQRLHRADEFEGTGIGLATVQRIVHRHGGRIWGEGQVGVGATFYVSLPKP